MDIDLVCFYDLKELIKIVGYEKYKKMLWHDTTDPDLGTGLHEIKGDTEINEMRGCVVMQMGPKEFHIYVEHVVDIPEVVEEHVIAEDASSSYKEDFEEEASKEGSDLSPKTAKKRQSKKYTGARRRHVLRDGNKTNDGLGQNSGPRPDLWRDLGGLSNANNVDASGKRAATSDDVNIPSVDPNAFEQDSDYERPYEYESEAFNSPISSENEGRISYDSFNKETTYGEVEFKHKNERNRVRAVCSDENCNWLILCSGNSKLTCFHMKTLYNEHACGRDQMSNLTTRAWCTSKLVKRLAIQPDIMPRHAMYFMIEEYNLQLNPRMISRALKAAREKVVGNEATQYGRIREYLQELH
ncbi:hypothetical protein PIB30_027382 [Stylosanthes scabra]|uniref:PB1-like domain-containing protein n=1 Tax=Stylosanthes scabra TaxID=79078 RepID=A0ABU6TAB8_9FABA|nr:hypothetical protein [Stylosanthes scabra]